MLESLSTSTALSKYYYPAMIPPLDVVRVLNKAKIKFTLVGAHAIGNWTHRPRTTNDVDVVVAARHVKPAVAALLSSFDGLVAEDTPYVVRLKQGEAGQVVIDVMKPNQAVIKAALTNTHVVTTGRLTYSIPTLEMALALKFAAMISLYRGDVEKFQDASDFLAMIRANADTDSDQMSVLGELVYPGGGKEIVSMVVNVRAGKKLKL